MSSIKSDDVQSKETTKDFISRKKVLLVIFTGCLLISVLGHFVIDNHSIIIITNHLGGLGIIGLFAYLTRFIAKRKGYNYIKAFKLSFFLPIIIGFLAAIIISFKIHFFYCGGGVSLLISFLLVIIVLIMKRKKIHL